jgi:hypothetical protein
MGLARVANVNYLGDSVDIIKKNAKTLIDASKGPGPDVNKENV